MKHRLFFLLLIILFFFSEITVSASVIDKSYKVDSKTLQKLNQGKSHAEVLVLLTGYKNYIGKIRSDKRSDMAKSHASIQSKQDTVLKQLHPSHFIIKHRFENIPGFSARVTQEGIHKLASLPDVEVIESDEMVEAHLAQGIPLMHASSPRSLYSGTGVSVAIVDTGIDYNHSMLGGGGFPNAKVIGGYDFGDEDDDPSDCHGHGTSVAGISAGTLAAGPGDYIGGVAHNSKLYALKIVSGCEGSAWDSDIVAAWDWAVSHKNDDPDNPILIINTSFGEGKYLSACDSSQQTLAAVANNAVANGITLFGSSGNDTYIDGIASPACVSGSISVGAVYDANVGSHAYSNCTDSTTAADKITCYSNSAGFLDMLAPSHNAYTTAVGGGYTSTFGGTSAASPYAAGVGALVQSYARSVTGFYYSANELKTRLLKGDLITDPRNNITKPRVNADYALYFAILKTTVPPAIDGDISEFADTDRITFSPLAGGNTAMVKALWDDEALYLAYEVIDTELDAEITTRDDLFIWSEDSVEWGIDANNDSCSLSDPDTNCMLPDDYHGIVNIMNTQYDERGSGSGVPSASWNGNWQSAVVKAAGAGYTAEVKIPWTTIGYSASPSGDTLVRIGFLLNDRDGASYNNAYWSQGGGLSFPNAANWGELFLSSDVLFPYYCDDDNDGYVDMSIDGTCISTGCEPSGCQITYGNDCDDSNSSVSVIYWYPDTDRDGYGNPSISIQQCTQPAGPPVYVLDHTDYDDNDPNIYPGGPAVRISGTKPVYYMTLQEAYNSAVNGARIQVQAVTFTENLSININKPISFNGGYNGAFTSNAGNSTLKGNMTITNGTLNIENFIVQ